MICLKNSEQNFKSRSFVVKRILEELGLDYSMLKPIEKGWSQDKKYYFCDKNGKEILLRLSHISNYDRKKKEYQIMQEISKLNINMSYPLDFGKNEEREKIFLLQSWVAGEELSERILDMKESEQYDLGISVGQILKKMHSLTAPCSSDEWEERMIERFTRHYEKYKEAGIKIENDEFALKYIKDNFSLLKNRPQVLQHGDFHINNFIFTENNSLGIIDFNRCDYGDP